MLSGAFVGRLLVSCGYSGAFDKNYRISVIDQAIKNVEWTYSDFIEVAGVKSYVLHFCVHSSPENTEDAASADDADTIIPDQIVNPTTEEDETKANHPSDGGGVNSFEAEVSKEGHRLGSDLLGTGHDPRNANV